MCLKKYIKKDLHKYHHYLISPYFLPTFYLDEGSVSKCPGWVKFLDEGLLCLAIALLNPTSEVDESSMLISPEKAPAVVWSLVLIQGRIDPFVGVMYLTILANYLKDKEETPDNRHALMMTYIVRGEIYHKLWKIRSAIEDYSRAIEIGEELYNRYPDDKEIANSLAMAYYNRGIAYYNLREYYRAIEDYNRAIEIRQKLHNLYPNDKEIANDLAMAYYNRGIAYYNLGKYEMAIEDYNRAIEIWEELHKQYPDDKEIAYDLAAAYYNRGNAYSRLGDLTSACADYQKALNLFLAIGNKWGVQMVLENMSIARCTPFPPTSP